MGKAIRGRAFMAKEWKVRRVRTRVSQIEYREREKEENKREREPRIPRILHGAALTSRNLNDVRMHGVDELWGVKA